MLYRYVIFPFMFFLFASCTPQTLVTSGRVIPVSLPPVSDSVSVTFKSDSLVAGVHAHLTDTVAVIKYFPGKEKFFYKVRLDTVYLQVRDTILMELPAGKKSFDYTKWIIPGIVTLLLTGLFYRMMKG